MGTPSYSATRQQQPVCRPRPMPSSQVTVVTCLAYSQLIVCHYCCVRSNVTNWPQYMPAGEVCQRASLPIPLLRWQAGRATCWRGSGRQYHSRHSRSVTTYATSLWPASRTRPRVSYRMSVSAGRPTSTGWRGNACARPVSTGFMEVAFARMPINDGFSRTGGTASAGVWRRSFSDPRRKAQALEIRGCDAISARVIQFPVSGGRC